jgi:hypothetical protein
MPVGRLNASVGAGNKELGCDQLFDGKNNAVLDTQTECGATIVDGLGCIFNLEHAAIGRIG